MYTDKPHRSPEAYGFANDPHSRATACATCNSKVSGSDNTFRREQARPDALSRFTLASVDLTPREQEVLFWIAQGKTNSEISVLCGISVRTVHKHVEHIYQKLGVETRTAAMLRAIEMGSIGFR